MRKLAKGNKIGPYPYRIIRQLGEGEGGMSIVYLASIDEVDQPKAEQLVALKIAKVGNKQEEFYRQTVDNEVEYLSNKLKHSGIVCLLQIPIKTPNPIYSAQATLFNGTRPWFLVMEYLAGGSLADLLKRQKKLDIGLGLRIAHKLAKTLEYIHDSGHVHLDIKPENVVFREPLSREVVTPVLIDFGIARAIGQGGLEAGTYIWLSPERLQNENLPPERMASPHPSMDIYALGLLLYRMLAGQLPFQGSRKSITSAILIEVPTVPSNYNSLLKPELDQLILSAMAKEPSDRPTTGHFVQILEDLINRPEYSDYDVPSIIASDHGKNSGFLKGLIGVVFIILVFMLYFFDPWVIHNPFATATTTPTPIPTVTEVAPTAIPKPTATAIPSKTVSPTPIPSSTATKIPTSTPVPTFTSEPTFVPTATQTPVPTNES